MTIRLCGLDAVAWRPIDVRVEVMRRWLGADLCAVQFFSRPWSEGWPHHGRTFSIYVLCHSDWLFHKKYCPYFNVVHPGCAWFSSPACTWNCSLLHFFLQATPLFLHGVTSTHYRLLVSLLLRCQIVTSLLKNPIICFLCWSRGSPSNSVICLAVLKVEGICYFSAKTAWS